MVDDQIETRLVERIVSFFTVFPGAQWIMTIISKKISNHFPQAILILLPFLNWDGIDNWDNTMVVRDNVNKGC